MGGSRKNDILLMEIVMHIPEHSRSGSRVEASAINTNRKGMLGLSSMSSS